MDISIDTLLAIGGFLISAFALWYKLRSDVETKVTAAFDKADQNISSLKADLDIMRSTAISRAEHDQDIAKVQFEIRSFREEVREDLRDLGSNLTSRLDLMMQRVMDWKAAKD